MRKRFGILLLASVTLLSVTHITFAQSGTSARDFLYVGIDPATLDAGKNSDIYLVRSDGSRVVNLTNSPFDSENKAYWSEDGQQIIFSRNSVARYGNNPKEQSSTSFYVMDISDAGDKLGERLLFQLSDLMGQPTRVEDWVLSPDQKQVAFIPYDETSGGTYVVNLDGTQLRERVGKGIASSYVPLEWSPDSRELAYQARECLLTHVNTCPFWVIEAVGDKPAETVGTKADLMKRWYADGAYAFMNSDGFEVHQGDRVIWKGKAYRPVVAPDGHTLAFSLFSDLTNKGTLNTVDLKSGQQTTLTNTDADILFIYWSPDSRQIAFCVYLGSFNDLEVYTINPDGSSLKKVFRRQSWNGSPLSWRPNLPTKDG